MTRRSLNIVNDCAGASAIEFALLAPVLLVLALGLAQFGMVLNNYVVLTEAVADGARNFGLRRGSTTPRSTTVTLLTNAAVNLTGTITITTKVNGTTCATDTACQTALTSAVGGAATVTATYPCNLVVMGVNYAPGCTLSSTTVEMIQ